MREGGRGWGEREGGEAMLTALVLLPFDKICFIFGPSSLSPQYNRLHIEALG